MITYHATTLGGDEIKGRSGLSPDDLVDLARRQGWAAMTAYHHGRVVARYDADAVAWGQSCLDLGCAR